MIRRRNRLDHRQARRQRAWRVATWVVLVLGLAGPALSGWKWCEYDQSTLAQDFASRASSVSAALDAGMERDLEFETSVGQLVASDPDLTNAQLGPWLESLGLDRLYPGAVGFTFYKKVPVSDLAAYLNAMAGDPEPGLGQVPSTILTDGSRSYYCLPRFGIVLQTVGTSAGMDLCSPTIPGLGVSAIAPLMMRAVTTGQPQFLNLGTVLAPVATKLHLSAAVLAEYKGLFTAFSPVYKGGSVPTTVAGRERTIIGWMSGTFNGPALLSAAVPHLDGWGVSLSTAEGQNLARSGPAGGGGELRQKLNLPAVPALEAVVTGPRSSAPVWQGAILGLIGAAVSVLLLAFMSHLGRSREKALRLVDQRTAQLREQALHDDLTGLPNRALLFDRAEQMVERARNRAASIGALFVDLDNFKDVNDTFGHEVGDQLLIAVAGRLERTVRNGDTVGRLGGDEFLILTETVGPGPGAEAVAQRVIQAMEEPFELHTPEPISFSVKASVGLATGARVSSQELIRDADVALYSAKEAGKGRYVLFNPDMQAAIQDRLTLEMELQGALDRQELFVVYQPIVDLHTLTTRGLEALIRWNHPERGLTGPVDFIPIAEQSGLIIPIGRFVLEQACADLVRWRRQGYDLSIAVNVSAAQFSEEGFARVVRTALSDHQLDPHCLTLEITETLLMRDTQATTRALAELKAIGVRIAIDDFGTGHSSLAYLRQFPIDQLKIDRSFITRLGQNAQAVAIVHTLVQLGKILGIETLAEGIEDQSQLAQLQEEMCDSGQGFLFARPLPAAELPGFLAEHGVTAHDGNPIRQ